MYTYRTLLSLYKIDSSIVDVLRYTVLLGRAAQWTLNTQVLVLSCFISLESSLSKPIEFLKTALDINQFPPFNNLRYFL